MAGKKKVVVIGSFLADYSASLANELKDDFDVTLIADKKDFTRNVGNDRVGELLKRGKISFFSQHKIWFRWSSSFKLIAKILAIRPDFVITHEHIHPHITLAYYAISKISKILLIVHDPKPHTGRDSALVLKNMMQREKQRSIAYRWLVHGSYCKNLLEQMVPVDRKCDIISVPLGANFSPNKITIPPLNKKVLMFGRMEEYKGLDFLLEIIKETYNKDKSIKFILAGNGPELDRLYNEFTLMKNTTILPNFIPLNEIKEVITDSDVFIAPYSEATQSGVVSCAFAFGRPVIATDVGGLPDFIKDGYNGKLLKYGDVLGFSNAIVELTNNAQKLNSLCKNSADTYKNDISWNKIAKEISRNLLL